MPTISPTTSTPAPARTQTSVARSTPRDVPTKLAPLSTSWSDDAHAAIHVSDEFQFTVISLVDQDWMLSR